MAPCWPGFSEVKLAVVTHQACAKWLVGDVGVVPRCEVNRKSGLTIPSGLQMVVVWNLESSGGAKVVKSGESSTSLVAVWLSHTLCSRRAGVPTTSYETHPTSAKYRAFSVTYCCKRTMRKQAERHIDSVKWHIGGSAGIIDVDN